MCCLAVHATRSLYRPEADDATGLAGGLHLLAPEQLPHALSASACMELHLGKVAMLYMQLCKPSAQPPLQTTTCAAIIPSLSLCFKAELSPPPSPCPSRLPVRVSGAACSTCLWRQTQRCHTAGGGSPANNSNSKDSLSRPQDSTATDG